MIKREPTQDIDRAVQVFVKEVEHDQNVALARKDITYRDFLSNKMLIVHSIRRGIPYQLFRLIQRITPFSLEDWAGFLNLSTKSLQRYQSAKEYIFKPIHSEKIIELAEVTNLGTGVFGDLEKFRLWLITPNFALGNLQPIELLKDSYGKDLVLNELTRIDHGIFA